MGTSLVPRPRVRHPRRRGGLDLALSLTTPEAKANAARSRLAFAERAHERRDLDTATYHAGKGLEILGIELGPGVDAVEALRRALG